MISTNLSTRPFYNERLVHTVLVVVGVLVLTVTLLSALTIVTLTRRDARQRDEQARAMKKAAEARREASLVRHAINPTELAAVVARAEEANALIDARTFSWTQLLARFEDTLPADVRITSISPILDEQGNRSIMMTVVGRRAEDINEFAENLESKGGFTDVRPLHETVDQDGLRETALAGRYVGTPHRGN